MTDAQAAIKKGSKKAPKKVAKKAAPKGKTTGGIPLKRILPASMDAKVARRKLRKAGIKGHTAQSRWEFSEAQVSEVKKVLGI